MRVQFERFYTYAELTETLEAWAAIGKESPELRAGADAVRQAYQLGLIQRPLGDD